MIKQLSNLNQSWKLPEWVDEGHYRLWIDIKGWPLLDIWAYIGWPPPNINCLEVIYSHEGWNQDAHHTQGGKRPREGGINGHSMELVCTHPNIGINVGRERGSSISSTLRCQGKCSFCSYLAQKKKTILWSSLHSMAVVAPRVRSRDQCYGYGHQECEVDVWPHLKGMLSPLVTHCCLLVDWCGHPRMCPLLYLLPRLQEEKNSLTIRCGSICHFYRQRKREEDLAWRYLQIFSSTRYVGIWPWDGIYLSLPCLKHEGRLSIRWGIYRDVLKYARGWLHSRTSDSLTSLKTK